MPFLGTTGGGSVKQYGGQANLGYFIKNSLRTRQSASGYLSRTPASASNRKTWTWSAWIKRGSLSSYQRAMTVTVSGYNEHLIFRDTDVFHYYSDSATISLITTQVFRDPSAWYHMVLAVDTTQATNTNRVKLYVNGTQVTSFSTATYPSQNADTSVNNALPHGISGPDSSQYFDGYQAEVNLIDGQALTPSSFGKTDAVTGQWIPKKFAGTYGTNGFYLKFADASAATAAAIGKDSSPNGNNWTPNNISVTAGATYDAMIDSPTLSAVASNYATFNPLDSYTPSGTITVSNGNLKFTKDSTGTHAIIRGTIGVSTGKWYWEALLETVGGGWPSIGIIGTGTIINAGPYVGAYSTSYGYNATGASGAGTIYNNGSGTTYGAFYAVNDIIGIAFDADAGTLIFYKNGVSQGTYTGIPTGVIYLPAFSCYNTGAWSVNFGQRAFAYTPPSGYKSLNTFNLP